MLSLDDMRAFIIDESTLSTHFNVSDENAVILRYNEVGPYIQAALRTFSLDDVQEDSFFV